MCRLCDRIYRVSEPLPELEDCIQLDPEGCFQMHINYYQPKDGSFNTTTRCINFCPECGKDLNKLLTPSPQSI